MSAVATPAKQPGIVIETVEGFLCINEGCDDRRIPRHCTKKSVDRETGHHIVEAYCESCQKLYKITRRPNGSTWGEATVEVITDKRRIASFVKLIAHLKGVMLATSH